MESKENAAQVHDDEPVEALLRDPFGFIQERFRTALTEERAPRDGDWGIREVAHRLTADAIKFNSLPEINASGGIETIREHVMCMLLAAEPLFRWRWRWRRSWDWGSRSTWHV